MKKFLDLLKKVDTIIITILVFALFLIIGLQILSRLLPGNAISWTIELGEILMVYMVWLGIASVACEDGHTKVDLLYRKFPPKAQHIAHTVGSALTVLYLLLLAWFVVGAINQYLTLNQGTVLLNINMAWVRLPLLVGSLLMAVTVILKEIEFYREMSPKEVQ